MWVKIANSAPSVICSLLPLATVICFRYNSYPKKRIISQEKLWLSCFLIDSASWYASKAIHRPSSFGHEVQEGYWSWPRILCKMFIGYSSSFHYLLTNASDGYSWEIIFSFSVWHLNCYSFSNASGFSSEVQAPPYDCLGSSVATTLQLRKFSLHYADCHLYPRIFGSKSNRHWLRRFC